MSSNSEVIQTLVERSYSDPFFIALLNKGMGVGQEDKGLRSRGM